MKERYGKTIITPLKDAVPNSLVLFGRYPTRADGTVKPVLWRVLEADGQKALLITDKGIDVLPYNKPLVHTSWETCLLRNYMNHEMLDEMFTDAEKECIITSHIITPPNVTYGIPGGNATDDKLFLLSINEVEEYFEKASAYFKECNDRTVKPTAYAKSRGAHMNEWGNAAWVLRTPGRRSIDVSFVRDSGFIYDYGTFVIFNYPVRPACWVDLTKMKKEV